VFGDLGVRCGGGSVCNPDPVPGAPPLPLALPYAEEMEGKDLGEFLCPSWLLVPSPSSVPLSVLLRALQILLVAPLVSFMEKEPAARHRLPHPLHHSGLDLPACTQSFPICHPLLPNSYWQCLVASAPRELVFSSLQALRFGPALLYHFSSH
jgi:hypothetical protein